MGRKIFIFTIALLCLSAAAVAHPLGNFSVNQYSRLEISTSQIKIRQVLDMAEIPTFQELSLIDADKNGVSSEDELKAYIENITPVYIANLRLSVNGEPSKLSAVSSSAKLNDGVGGLKTLMLVWDLTADLKTESGRVAFENLNHKDRLGWNEIVVTQTSAKVFDSTAYGSGVTDELKAYPDESLSAPLAERSAQFSFGATAAEGAVALVNRDGHIATVVQRDRFAELISIGEITPGVVLFSLLLAFGLGAVHAMSPGHGKTVVGAYLVGTRGTAKHAAFLGLTVTITHTLGVFALGLITLFASSYVVPERLMPFLSFVSGLLVFYIGVTLFKNRLFSALGWSTTDHGHHHHHHEHDAHGHEHSHDGFSQTHDGHTHSHLPPEAITWKSLLALGISGGLLPCPSALVLMLSAISLGRVGYGLILTVVFSLGLAATLTAVGLAFLYFGKALGSSGLSNSRIVKSLPAFSAFVIACIGAVMCYNSIA